MRSESEIRWVRAKNNVGQRVKVTDWHAIIPGHGSRITPPGTACNVGLTGSLQFVEHSAIRTLDGQQHDECVGIVNAWLESIDPSPGALRPPDPEVKLAAPDTEYVGPGTPVKRLPG